jgi:hypothetical protein
MAISDQAKSCGASTKKPLPELRRVSLKNISMKRDCTDCCSIDIRPTKKRESAGLKYDRQRRFPQELVEGNGKLRQSLARYRCQYRFA